MISKTLCDQTGFVLELLTPWFSLAWFPSYITCLYHAVTIFVKLTSTVAVFDWLIRLGNSPSAFRKIFAEGSFFLLCLPSSERCFISVAYLFFFVISLAGALGNMVRHSPLLYQQLIKAQAPHRWDVFYRKLLFKWAASRFSQIFQVCPS